MLVAKELKKIFVFKQSNGWFKPSEVKRVVAVEDISLEVLPGQIVGLLGINGAGKSTMIKMLAAILEPSSGSININDIDALIYPQEVRKIINMITGGERNIYWRLTARENLEYFGSLYNLTKAGLSDYIEKALDLVGLNEAADLPVERYSKGMKQRLQIARGLVNNPAYLYLDEPTLGLDVMIAKEMRSYIKKLAKEDHKGILLTSHYIAEVEELCDHVYVMDKGTIIAEGTPKELANIASPYKEITVTLPHLPEQVEQAIRVIASKNQSEFIIENQASDIVLRIRSRNDVTISLLKALTDNELPILQFSITEPRLEDSLLQLAASGEKR